MKKHYFWILFFVGSIGFAQEDAWVYFTNKPNAQFYLDNPLEMLSQRALDRRANQNIALDVSDVPIHQPYLDELANQDGIEIKAQSKWFNCVHVRGSFEAIIALQTLLFVQEVKFADRTLNVANRKKNTSNQFIPVHKQLSVQSDFNYGQSANQIQMLNGHLLHQQNYTGTGKIIAVMDAGFPQVDVVAPFQRIRENNQILGGYNFVDKSEDFYTRDSHGTMVLSTMAGYAENQLVGTAPDANYYLFITEDADSENPIEESNWVEAAEMADSLGVDVINTSLGYFEYDNPNYSYTYEDLNGQTAFMSLGAEMAFAKGMICVTSAGNSGASMNPYVAVPGESIHTLTVGAVKADETYASFSSIGPTFDGRVKPDVMARGQNATVATPFDSIITANGTSFSGPIMAGMVASFWQAIPQLTNQQVIDYIRQSADRFSNPNEYYGYGIPDFQVALTTAQLSVPEYNSQLFLLYPNPSNTNVYVSFPNEVEEVVCTLYDTLGQKLKSKNLTRNNNSISLTEYQKGIYYCQIETKRGIQTVKIIKN